MCVVTKESNSELYNALFPEDEIKEILDYISDRIIPNEKWNKVRDYITYLQEENQRLEENNQNMQVEMARSWERIDKAIEKLKYYSGGEADYYVPIEYIIKILKGDKND